MALSTHAAQIKDTIGDFIDDFQKFNVVVSGNRTYSAFRSVLTEVNGVEQTAEVLTIKLGLGIFDELVIITANFGGVRSSYDLAGDNILADVYIPYEKITAIITVPN